MTATLSDLRFRWFLRKCCRATRRDRARVLRPVPRRHSPAVWAKSMAVLGLLVVVPWVIVVGGAVTLWGLR